MDCRTASLESELRALAFAGAILLAIGGYLLSVALALPYEALTGRSTHAPIPQTPGHYLCRAIPTRPAS